MPIPNAPAADVVIAKRWNGIEALRFRLREPRGLRTRLIPTSDAARGAELAVVVHAYGKRSTTLAQVVHQIREQRGAIDVLVVEHAGAVWWSNERPERVADRIVRAVDAWCERAAYQSIMLVGHSAGGLLARKCFLHACGRADDIRPDEPPHDWVTQVDQILTLAAMDRGWTLDRFANVNVLAYLAMTLIYHLGRVLHIGGFIRSLQRGEPFVVNTRVQWLRLLYDASRPDEPTAGVAARPELVPPVIQLVGDKDGVVAFEDNVDLLLASSAYTYRVVSGVNHLRIVRVEEYEDLARAFAEALRIRRSSVAPAALLNPLGKPREAGDVFYIVHGIRDRGHTWVPQLAQAVKDANAPHPAWTVTESYGYFSALSFLRFKSREKNVRWFMDEYVQQMAAHPDATHNYIGHSNGTYILANAFKRYTTCKMRYVVFAGSVVPTAYKWRDVFDGKRVERVRNYAGCADWVVASLPRLFEFLCELLGDANPRIMRALDLGSAGFNGFDSGRVNNDFYACLPKYGGRRASVWAELKAGHGVAFSPPNHMPIAETVVKGTCTPTPVTLTDDQVGVVALIGKFSWVIPFLALVGIIVFAPQIEDSVRHHAGWWIMGLVGFVLLMRSF
ncbi:MAG TPA: alpha/beta hydrolase [Candidatus Elarobacter sp.]|jgi:hypothetical protein